MAVYSGLDSTVPQLPPGSPNRYLSSIQPLGGRPKWCNDHGNTWQYENKTWNDRKEAESHAASNQDQTDHDHRNAQSWPLHLPMPAPVEIQKPFAWAITNQFAVVILELLPQRNLLDELCVDNRADSIRCRGRSSHRAFGAVPGEMTIH
jgi:hypothetical protein